LKLEMILKKVLKPSVLKAIEAKTDSSLIEKINFVGMEGAVRLNCASQLQLQALNAQNAFKVICFDLPDPWTYYWKMVCNNSSHPGKWYESMKEVQNVPFLVERCFSEMTLSGVYPENAHYDMVLKSGNEIGDYVGGHEIFDDFARCATEIGRPDQASWQNLFRSWIKASDFTGASLIREALQDKKFNLSAEDEAALAALEKNFDASGAFNFASEQSQLKPTFQTTMEETEATNTKAANQHFVDFLQPPLEKLLSPEEVQVKRDSSPPEEVFVQKTTHRYLKK